MGLLSSVTYVARMFVSDTQKKKYIYRLYM